MQKPFMKRFVLVSLLVFSGFAWAQAQEAQTIKLVEPNKKGGLPAMEALSIRASSTSWSDRELSPQDLSDLLWAANGINRPDIKKRTASSAMNAQDVDIYVFMKDGVYIYDAANHALNPVVTGDHRAEIRMSPGGAPPRGGAPGQGGRTTCRRARSRSWNTGRPASCKPGADIGHFQVQRGHAGIEI